MKKVLIISNEECPQNLGRISRGIRFGLANELYDIPNLRDVIRRFGGFDISTVHHSQINKQFDPTADYIILSGRFSGHALTFEQMLDIYENLIEWIKISNVPILGICMGHQLICAAFGVKTMPMNTEFGEYGFTELNHCGNHALTEGVPQYFHCMEMHKCQVESVPNEFDLIASSENCKVQMICHKVRPIVGTQFHPELNTDAQQDGLLILRKFFDTF